MKRHESGKKRPYLSCWFMDGLGPFTNFKSARATIHNTVYSLTEQNVMKSLLEPKNDKNPVFDLVVPSLPGFCWSQGPPRRWTLQDTARVYDELMRRLGYRAYVAQAGDWGHWVIAVLCPYLDAD